MEAETSRRRRARVARREFTGRHMLGRQPLGDPGDLRRLSRPRPERLPLPRRGGWHRRYRLQHQLQLPSGPDVQRRRDLDRVRDPRHLQPRHLPLCVDASALHDAMYGWALRGRTVRGRGVRHATCSGVLRSNVDDLFGRRPMRLGHWGVRVHLGRLHLREWVRRWSLLERGHLVRPHVELHNASASFVSERMAAANLRLGGRLRCGHVFVPGDGRDLPHG